MSDYNKNLNLYPKKRINLDLNYKKIYENHYIHNREGKGIGNYLSKVMESWMHKKVASVIKKDILEIGAGNINHLRYEKNYLNYDIVEPFENLYRNNPQKKKIRNIFNSLHQVNNKYDKIISIAVLEHLTDLPNEIQLCKKLLKDDGIFQVAIPCEGEFAFKLGWMLTTAISFKLKYKLDYSRIIEYEHVNTMDEIITILKHHFNIKKIKRSPFILPFKNLSFYAYLECEHM